MNRNAIIMITWGSGILISPEFFTLQGNFTGTFKLFFVFPFIGSVLLHWFHLKNWYPPFMPNMTSIDEIDRLVFAFGRFGAAALLLWARPFMAVCIATASLVTSGFVFNETFIYWFPNFAFAAILLILILAVNLVGTKAASTAQVIFTISAAAGWLALIGIGLLRIAFSGEELPIEPQTIRFNGHIWGATILFIGYEMVYYSPQATRNVEIYTAMRSTLLIVAGLFICWNLIGLKFVSSDRLIATRIPHTLIAKSLSGQNGRYLMGLVSIMSSLAVTNALFLTVSRMVLIMVEKQIMPGFILGSRVDRPYRILSGLTILSAISMGLGFAGTDLIDIAIYASLLTWLLFYALSQLGQIVITLSNNSQIPTTMNRKYLFQSIVLILITVISATALFLKHPNTKELFYIVLLMLGAALLAAKAGLSMVK